MRRTLVQVFGAKEDGPPLVDEIDCTMAAPAHAVPEGVVVVHHVDAEILFSNHAAGRREWCCPACGFSTLDEPSDPPHVVISPTPSASWQTCYRT